MKGFSGIAPILAVVAGLVFIGLAGNVDGGRATARTAVAEQTEPGATAQGAAKKVEDEPVPGQQHIRRMPAEDEARPDPAPVEPPVESQAGAVREDDDERAAHDDLPQVYGGKPVSMTRASKYVLLDNIGFDVGYSESRKAPVWVGYRVDSKTLPGHYERPETFSVDVRTRARVTHQDYTGSGYDRGHMAPNHAIVSRYGQEAQLETFLMSNIVPQRKELNRHVWKDIEELEATSWSKRLQEVWVITGPVYDDKPEFLRGRQSGIEIPDAFFKVVIDETQCDSGAVGDGSKKGGGAAGRWTRQGCTPRVLAFMIPQNVTGTEKPGEFLVSVDWIEDRTGLDLMPDLPDDLEVRLESEVADHLW